MRGNRRKSGPAGASVFGAALRRHRRRLGLSQEDLADATHGGVAVRTISDLERGVARRPRAETARLLAAALRLAGPDLADFTAAASAGGRATAEAEAAREAEEAAAKLTALAAAGLAEPAGAWPGAR